MQVFFWSMPQFHPEKSKTQVFPARLIPCNSCTIFVSFCSLEDSKHSKTNTLAMQHAFMTRELQCFASKVRKWEKSKFMVFSKACDFFMRFTSLKNGNFRERTNAIFSDLIEGQLQFHVRKRVSKGLQNFRKQIEIQQFFDKIVTFWGTLPEFHNWEVE